jgi:pyrroloquinoline quinone biosynthesis protein B
VSSIALVDPDTGDRWIFDATPDLPAQFQYLKVLTGDASNRISGIFLTHAHIGHYTGLMYLGRESMNAKGVKVWAMPRMKEFLEKNGPWSQLVSLGNISIMPLADLRSESLSDEITVTPYLVPHRDEYSETVGFRIQAGNYSLMFIPDIDKWQKWGYGLAKAVKENDYLLVDGTFYRDGEIARPISEVPHPFVKETMDLLKDLPQVEKRKVWFIHFNHTNPLVQGSGKELSEVAALGFGVATKGKTFELGAGKR